MSDLQQHRPAPSVPAGVALALTGLLGVLPLTGCGSDGDETPSAAPGSSQAASQEGLQVTEQAEIERAIRDLVTAVTPLPADAPVGVQSEWFPTRRATLRRLRAGGPTLGRAALAEFHERDTDLDDVRAGLLDVAAHAATEETLPVLVMLVETYGPSLKLRRTATELIGAVAPEEANRILTPIVSNPEPGKTYPPSSIMLAAWLEAAGSLKFDRVPLLAKIALDYRQPDDARHLATKALGDVRADEDRPAAIEALRTLLVESSGNNYLRRKAAQALRTALPKGELCRMLEDVLAREAEPSFGIFLSDMIENECR